MCRILSMLAAKQVKQSETGITQNDTHRKNRRWIKYLPRIYQFVNLVQKKPCMPGRNIDKIYIYKIFNPSTFFLCVSSCVVPVSLYFTYFAASIQRIRHKAQYCGLSSFKYILQPSKAKIELCFIAFEPLYCRKSRSSPIL